jgi:DNA recombination protein RmuC
MIYLLLALNTILLGVVIWKMFQGSGQENSDRIERVIREEIAGNRQELSRNLESFSTQLLKLTEMNDVKLERVREIVDKNLRSMQEDNNRKLETIRQTVDEKLHSTLEKRLGESFQIVSDRLERVHQGLGEMQNLAAGVGDLKKVLTNVKTRGTWGEVQLGNLLEQVFTLEQYERNFPTKQGSRDLVEFAIKLPGRHGGAEVYLPIDAKFPLEDYQRLLEAQDQANLIAIEEFSRAIEARIKLEAKTIREKYLDPPNTTDFGILFLPIESLYAEVLRRPGFCDALQRDYRVVVAGPTTILAILNSLQMGFRTLAVEKRASEVWQLLGIVKTEFGKFGEILQKTQDKLHEASNIIETAASKSRNIESKLKRVQDLPSAPSVPVIEPKEINESIVP